MIFLRMMTVNERHTGDDFLFEDCFGLRDSAPVRCSEFGLKKSWRAVLLNLQTIRNKPNGPAAPTAARGTYARAGMG